MGSSELIFPLLMKPVFDPRPWGGRRFETLFGRLLPDGPVGESWEISAVTGKVSRIEGGPLDGMTLDAVLERWPVATMGRLAKKEFPLLVKFVDAAENLSVQVHPDDDTAQRLENQPRGKTEAWIVLDPGKSSEVIHGLADGTTREAMQRAADLPAIEPLLRRSVIDKGSVIPVTAGTVHAILAGTLLCEIQQSSDITYRLYDWGRKPRRELHVDKSLESIKFAQRPPHIFYLPLPAPTPRRPRPFLDLKYFTLSIIEVSERGREVPIDLGDGDFALAVVLEDGGTDIEARGYDQDRAHVPGVMARAGRSLFIPAALRGVIFTSTTPARILWVRPGV